MKEGLGSVGGLSSLPQTVTSGCVLGRCPHSRPIGGWVGDPQPFTSPYWGGW